MYNWYKIQEGFFAIHVVVSREGDWELEALGCSHEAFLVWMRCCGPCIYVHSFLKCGLAGKNPSNSIFGVLRNCIWFYITPSECSNSSRIPRFWFCCITRELYNCGDRWWVKRWYRIGRFAFLRLLGVTFCGEFGITRNLNQGLTVLNTTCYKEEVKIQPYAVMQWW